MLSDLRRMKYLQSFASRVSGGATCTFNCSCQGNESFPCISEASEAQVWFLLFEQLQLLILSDIKNKTVKVESIIISRLARDLQVSGGRIALGLS